MNIIYCAQNLINQKKYIGQTTHSLDARIRGHKAEAFSKKSKIHIHNALRKYGMENFVWTIICHASDQESLNRAEMYYIKYYRTMEIGYNHKEGGAHGKLSKQTKLKISIANKGKLSWMKGRFHSKETKDKIKEAREHQIFTKETRQKMSDNKKGIPWPKSEEVRKKLSESKIGIPLTEETKSKMSESRIGKKHSEITKGKMGITAKKRWAEPEIKIKRHIAALKQWMNPEIRKKRLESQKIRWENYHELHHS